MMAIDHSAIYKWNSCPDLLYEPLLEPERITKLHVYDFDNTLYCSPHPNRQILSKKVASFLLSNPDLPRGNWWADSRFLEQSFKDCKNSSEKESSTFWNQNLLKLAAMSQNDPETVSIVLTGRRELEFMGLIGQMLHQGNMDVKFNAVCLKKRIYNERSTAEYKIDVISDFIADYMTNLEEVAIYDDRESQMKKFKQHFQSLHTKPNFEKLSPKLKWYFVDVPPRSKILQPQDETNVVKTVVQEYNIAQAKEQLQLIWSPVQTGFFLNLSSHKKLIAWTNKHFLKKPKRIVRNKYDYPSYIPCIPRGENLDPNEIYKIWTNGKTTSSQEDKDAINKKFYKQSYGNFHERCIVEFKIVEIGYMEMKSSDTSNPKGLPEIYTFYKVEPSKTNRYIHVEYPFLTIVGELATKTTEAAEEKLLDIVYHDNSAIVWSKVPPLRISTTFGQFSRMQLE